MSDNKTKEIYGYIYQTENLINGKKYIGQTTTKGVRFKSYLGSGVHFKKAIKKYGRENFEKTILSECFSREELDSREKLFITLFNPEYNIDKGGQGNQEKRSEATIKKISSANRGKKRTEASKQLMREKKLGKKLTREHAEKIRQANLGRVCSEETKRKISEANKGGMGRALPQSEEAKAKISAANKGKKRTPEMNRANSLAKKGIKQSRELIEKRRKGLMGHAVSEECRKKISEFHKGKQWFLGKHCSEETKEKISKSNTGKKRTEEAKKIMSDKKKGQKNHTTPHSQETKDKLGTKVLCIDTGIVYNTITLASEVTGTNRASVIKCCQKTRNKANNLRWEYFKENK